MLVYRSTGRRVHHEHMSYEVTFKDKTQARVDEADTFAHEKSMTTFYRTRNARQTVDCWSTPLASIRTDEILMIRWVQSCSAAIA